jgi:Domain of unknown function (DUF4157)
MAFQHVALANPAVIAPRLQKKTRIGPANDPLEREADEVADTVLGMTDTSLSVSSGPAQVSRKCATCEEEGKLQRKSVGTNMVQAHAPPIVHDVVSAPGRPLDSAARAYFEPRFGRDFSDVRVHAGPAAEQSAKDINAKAYTFGSHIVFDSGEYGTDTSEGKRLLAHELAHVVQQKHAERSVQRDTQPVKSAPQSVNPIGALFPNIAPDVSKRFSVRVLTEAGFQALSGVLVATIPQKRVLSPAEAGLDSDSSRGGGAGAALSAAIVFGPRPTLPLPLGSTGVLWSADAHLSQFAVVRQQNPALAFLFGDSTLKTYGFRANLARHALSTAESAPFLYGSAGGPFKASLNRGAAGGYVNDAVFPYVPVKGGSVAVYAQGGAQDLAGAEQLTACMAEAGKTGKLDGVYRFSTPPRDSPAFDRAFGKGAAADPNFQPPEIINCLNEANASKLSVQALQGRDLIMQINGRQVNVRTATYVDTGETVPGMLPGAAKSMREYVKPGNVIPEMQGLTRQPITSGMWLRGLTGVVRGGGLVMLVYNLDRTIGRYQEASEYDKPLVVGEEATLFTAGMLGSLLGQVIGEAVICAGLGPGFALCMIATSMVGGALATGAAEDLAHNVGTSFQTIAELHRQRKLLPGIMDRATQVLGTEQQKQILKDFKKLEDDKSDNPERPNGFNVFEF